jgi:hypothetical protein
MYLEDIYKIAIVGAYIIFGIRGLDEENWIRNQISKIDINKYKIFKLIIKSRLCRESILVLQKI